MATKQKKKLSKGDKSFNRAAGITQVEIEFDVTCRCQQTAEIYQKGLTVEKLQAGLRSGKYTTSLSNRGDILCGSKVVGRVVSVDTVDEDFHGFMVDECE